jgi:hypothetical protein
MEFHASPGTSGTEVERLLSPLRDAESSRKAAEVDDRTGRPLALAKAKLGHR